MQVNHIRMREIRESKSMRCEEVAVAADLSVRRIRQIENGELINLNLNIAKAIARKLRVKLEDIAK
jgi:DNA-binding XRE family transcriptional regulator